MGDDDGQEIGSENPFPSSYNILHTLDTIHSSHSMGMPEVDDDNNGMIVPQNLQDPNPANNHFQEWKSNCGMGSQEDKSHVPMEEAPGIEIVSNFEGHHDGRVAEQCVDNSHVTMENGGAPGIEIVSNFEGQHDGRVTEQCVDMSHVTMENGGALGIEIVSNFEGHHDGMVAKQCVDMSHVTIENGGAPGIEIVSNFEGHHDGRVTEQCVEQPKFENPPNIHTVNMTMTGNIHAVNMTMTGVGIEGQELTLPSEPCGLPLWVKRRGKWQAGIQCNIDDRPLETMRAAPTLGRKTYIVVFFPNARCFWWQDSQNVCAISEKPEPLAFGTHKTGQELVKDLRMPRRFMLQKLAVDMLEVSDKLHVEAVVESARHVNVWKEFAKEAAQCTTYSDLGRMLLKLHSMMLGTYISPTWMETFNLWKQQCENTKTAEATEKLKEDLDKAILWKEVGDLWNAPVQAALGEEWKTWKKEAMKLFPIYYPSTSAMFERNFDKGSREGFVRMSDPLDSANCEDSRKRQKLEIRRGNSSEVKDTNGSRIIAPGEVSYSLPIPYIGECQLIPYTGDSKSATKEEVILKNQSAADIHQYSNHGCKRCSAFIEKKGRQCNRFASEGGIYCVKHLNFNSPDNCQKVPRDESLSLNTQTDLNISICRGMTKYGRRCTHRTRNGTFFCLKHMLPDCHNQDDCDTTPSSSTLGNSQKMSRTSIEGCSLEKESTSADLCHKECENKQCSPPFSDMETMHGSISGKLDNDDCAGVMQRSQNFLLPEKAAVKVSNRGANWARCIGSCRNHGGQCSHRAKPGSSYCEKHCPSSLGHHNRYTISMLNEIFKDTTNEDLQCSNSKDLLHEYLKSHLLGGKYGLDENRGLDWIIGEVSKNVKDAEALLKEVSDEKQKLASYFGFEEKESDASAAAFSISEVENTPGYVPAMGNGVTMQSTWDGMDDLRTVDNFVANEAQNQKCKGCNEEFSDLQALSHHCITIHKKAAEWYFRGYACRNCSSSFTNKKGLERHVKIHHGGVSLEQCTGYFCIPCGSLSHFMDCDQLWQHVLLAHPEELNQSISIKDQVNSLEFSKPLNVKHEKQENFNQSNFKQDLSCEFDSEHKTEHKHNSISTFSEDTGLGENRTFVRDSVKRFSCRFCGMRFSLLPDLGRHHQAKHMGANSGYKPQHKRGKEAFKAKWRGNKANIRTIKASTGFKHASVISRKKRFKKNDIQMSIWVDNGAQIHNQCDMQDRFTESYLSAVVDMLLLEGQKVRSLPNNMEILNVARLACCRINLQAALEEKYGVLSEKLYIKAARLCSEENIRVEWHREGFICPKGCMPKDDTQTSVLLTPLPDVCLSPLTVQVDRHDIVTKETHNQDTWENLESHLVLNSCDLKKSQQRRSIILLEDLSFGKEAEAIPCVVDEDVISKDGEEQHLQLLRPWESFSYITNRMLDSSLGLAARSSQLGCTCTDSQCSPGSCDHVYLFENDNEDAQDIDGKSMNGRFPYDDKRRIILEKGYLVYECNPMCGCQKECQNRVLQNGVQVKLEVYKTKHKGWGVRAAQAISSGTFICEYIGEVLNDQEANKRGERYDKEGCSYLYDIDSHIDTNELNEFMESPKPYVIDATRYGNVARFINHSCSPNLVNYQVLIESMDCQLAHIGLYASRDIALGEELAYDYHYKLLPGEGTVCNCGAENCRGRLY